MGVGFCDTTNQGERKVQLCELFLYVRTAGHASVEI